MSKTNSLRGKLIALNKPEYFVRYITSKPGGQSEIIAMHIMKNGQKEPVEIFEKKNDIKFFDNAWSKCNKLNGQKRLSYNW